ncbi:putative beta-glucosidase D [Lachnellula hyalina]|uniref:beta-glucosidase n=1 Tax=Lachnellula hyalina TaxID=1316788 RepID=A0A8H8R835_9HELO|nr:putative beta-glucosidase D [Lachnellula hyalina]TVY30319.1 putative beta-glucosidase D [Lachnellula hyalina]
MQSFISSPRGMSLLTVALALFGPLVSGATYSNATATNSTTLGLLSSDTVTLDAKWNAAYAKAQALVAQLNNTEKVELITGSDVASVNWTALQFKDGDQGVISYYDASGFSETSALVQTWDRNLWTLQMEAVGAEMYGKGFQVVNGPTSGPLGRTPWGGRLVETMGQDVYLNGQMVGLATAGFLTAGVVPGGKHFLLNEQETNRSSLQSGTTTYTSNADDKTLHETYLFPFYDAVKSGMAGMMCAMSRVNGTQACENSYLLNTILKTELGFPGIVFPDADGQFTAFGSANGGEDYGSSSLWTDTLVAGITNGSFTKARLDDMAIRNVIPYYYADLDNGLQPNLSYATDYVDVRANHSAIIRQVGSASLSLLKNVNNALPLSKPKSLAIFGANAGPVMGGPGIGFSVSGTDSTYQGHLAGGSGSGTSTFPYLVTPHDALLLRAIDDGTVFRWIMNDTGYASSSGGMGSMGGSSSKSTGFGSGTNSAVSFTSYATDMEVCIVFLNAYSGEGLDRTELYNTDQDDLVISIASECNNTMVVLNTVGARLMDAWIENENVTAVVYGGLLGQNSGYSIADVLYGDVNPSGRLAYTIAKNESDYNVGICLTEVCEFTEGNYIDYKYFDSYNVTPRFEFGFGLSYTTFSYSDITVTQTAALNSTYATGTLSVGGREDLWTDIVNVTALISNTGSIDGHEVAQLYVSFPAAAAQPVRQLRGFERVLVGAGDDEAVSFALRRRDLSYWDVAAQEWAVAPGTYNFTVGASSRDLRLSATLDISI